MIYNRKSPLAIREEAELGRLLKSHPTILLKGPSATGVQRTLDALISIYVGDDRKGEIESVYKNNHPDVFWIDGREMTADHARELRLMATTSPAKWPRKFMIITHLDRPHYTVVPILLKVVEEPPDHFSSVLVTDNLKGIPQTIPSRALQLRITLPKQDEIEEYLENRGCDEPSWRANVCGGDPDVALGLEILHTRNWQKIWAAAATGSDLQYDFSSTWTDIFHEGKEETLTSCWEILIRIAALKVHQSVYWRDIALLAMKARDRSRVGKSNKLQVTSALVQCYALARTAAKRK